MQTPPLDTADLELDMLLAAVAARWGYDFRGYARASLQRRVAQAVEVAMGEPRVPKRSARCSPMEANRKRR